TRGAGLLSVRLLKYPETLDPDSAPVLLDFADLPALSYTGIPNLGSSFTFSVQALEDSRSLRFERRTLSGIRMVRDVTLEDPYLLRVKDTFFNESGAAVAFPAHTLRIGKLSGRVGESSVKGVHVLGVDTLSPGGGKVQYWGRKFPKAFQPDSRDGRLPEWTESSYPEDGRRVDWAALKEKYFTLILTPEGGADQVRTRLEREILEREIAEPGYRPKTATIKSVFADLAFAGRILPESGESIERAFTLYVGPKQYSELNRFAFHQVDVMEFGMWAPVGKILLKGLIFFHGLIPNYGVAIILLTCVIRLIFWPLTHKSGKSMRKMQELQPEIAKLKATIKDPKKQQMATLELYKKHKVNPVSGCLPMIIQIPVFIALFVVLRSAIELRFAPFLWIHDLSEPENLLPGALPFVSGLNLLPLIMTAVQIWQQKLTPAAGDPAQQKMMTFMPILMLVFFYNFASGLVLYWTTNQMLMIVQLLIQKNRSAHKTA
ncbi:MAG: membrane protein insertase YidC, partial [Kiritimatiellia bacterium]|nr:membrane protein insertase YidC [Kiritimatiellia bacterium]